jgi:hypothetical protein
VFGRTYRRNNGAIGWFVNDRRTLGFEVYHEYATQAAAGRRGLAVRRKPDRHNFPLIVERARDGVVRMT